MSDAYEHHVLIERRAAHSLAHLFGRGEEALHTAYLSPPPSNTGAPQQQQQQHACGSYECERTSWYGEFLELFVKLALDKSETWETLSASLNHTPLLPQCADAVRQSTRLLGNASVERQYLLTAFDDIAENNKYDQDEYEDEDNDDDEDEDDTFTEASSSPRRNRNRHRHRLSKGLFRSHSYASVALSEHANNVVTSVATSSTRPLMVMDFGAEYVPVCNLAIWLMEWAAGLQKLLLTASTSTTNNNRTTSRRIGDTGNGNESSSSSSSVTIRFNSLTANFLVACAHLANGNHLQAQAMRQPLKRHLQKKQQQKQQIERSVDGMLDVVDDADDDDDELTRISSRSITLVASRASKASKVSKVVIYLLVKFDSSDECCHIEIEQKNESLACSCH